jgi:predicted alpha/beta hydrolase family esterase
MHILLISRWSGHPTSDWYPWLAKQVADLGATIDVPALPHPESPEIASWTVAVREALGALPTGTRTLVVGHSVGNHAILRALASMDAPASLVGALFVAGWWTVDDAWPALIPWMHHDEDLAKARRALPFSEVLVSDNDPHTSDYRANAKEWETKIGSTVRIVPGARHFNGKMEPAVLEAVTRLVKK